VKRGWQLIFVSQTKALLKHVPGVTEENVSRDSLSRELLSTKHSWTSNLHSSIRLYSVVLHRGSLVLEFSASKHISGKIPETVDFVW